MGQGRTAWRGGTWASRAGREEPATLAGERQDTGSGQSTQEVTQQQRKDWTSPQVLVNHMVYGDNVPLTYHIALI